MMQSHQELQTKKQCKVWVKFLRQIIDDLNQDSNNKNKTQTKEISSVPIITENNKNILNINDKVQVSKEYPNIPYYNLRRMYLNEKKQLKNNVKFGLNF